MSSAEPSADAAPAESIQAALPVLEYSKPVRRWDLPRVVCVVLLVVGVLTCARLLLEMAMMAQTGFDTASQLWPYSLPRALPGDGAMMLLDSWAEYAYRFAWLCITAGAWRALRSESAGIAWLSAASVLLFAWGALESSSMVLSDPPIFTVGGHSIAGVRYCVMIAFAQLATPVLMIPLLRAWRMA